MLGLGPVSSRSVSGSPFKLTAVSAVLIASGALLTFGGSTNPGITVPGSASGVLVQFGGTAIPIWLQAATTQGTFLTLSGTATLRLAGKPVLLRAITQRYTANALAGSYNLKALSQVFNLRGR